MPMKRTTPFWQILDRFEEAQKTVLEFALSEIGECTGESPMEVYDRLLKGVHPKLTVYAGDARRRSQQLPQKSRD
jgi:ribosomal protein S7